MQASLSDSRRAYQAESTPENFFRWFKALERAGEVPEQASVVMSRLLNHQAPCCCETELFFLCGKSGTHPILFNLEMNNCMCCLNCYAAQPAKDRNDIASHCEVCGPLWHFVDGLHP